MGSGAHQARRLEPYPHENVYIAVEDADATSVEELAGEH